MLNICVFLINKDMSAWAFGNNIFGLFPGKLHKRSMPIRKLNKDSR